MATNTTKLGLIKPDFVDVVDITELNTNADDIDAAVGFAIVTSSTRPASPWTGQVIYETDTGLSLVWDGSAWIAITGTLESDVATLQADVVANRLMLETTEKTSSYTLALDDAYKVVLANISTGTITVPTNSSVAFPIGSVVNVYNANATDLTVAGDSGVTVRNAGDLAQYGEVSLRKRATDEWVLAGAVS